jgi:hypothetical protein
MLSSFRWVAVVLDLYIGAGGKEMNRFKPEVYPARET